MDANVNMNVFLQHWLFHRERLEYTDVDFEPDFNIPLQDDLFNLYFGLKIEIMHNIISYDYDQEPVEPLLINEHSISVKVIQNIQITC